ncbi:MAG: hypothetical protein ACOX47_00630 [Bacillota bacterium]|jgi:hypothetical protein
MNLIVLDQSYEYTNKPESIPYLLNRVEEILKENNMVLSHFVIDGVEVYEDCEGYLLNNVASVTNVNVELRTINELLSEMVISAFEYLKRSIPALDQLSAEFYQGPNQQSWLRFEEMLEGIEWLCQLVDQITQHEPLADSWKKTEQESSIQVILAELEEAVENQDNVLIADTITYEILPQYQVLKQKLSVIINTEVLKYGFN